MTLEKLCRDYMEKAGVHPAEPGYTHVPDPNHGLYVDFMVEMSKLMEKEND